MTSRSERQALTCTLLLVLATAHVSVAQSRLIDPHRSSITVQVAPSGMFSFLGDNHTIQAPIISGALDESRQTLTLEINARQMKVLDPTLSADKRAEVQQRMLGPEVLDVASYPSIVFHSASASWHGKEVMVHGELDLHGHKEPIEIRAVAQDGAYRGSASIRQTRFGIRPVRVAGGTVRVKDEVRIEFTVVPEDAKSESAAR
jgi:polyisoprenoid-binding protein YceI